MTFGQPRRHYQECASTNDIARAWASDPNDPAPHGALVTTDYQTRGRGQRERRWYALPDQSALLSFVTRPSLSWEQVPLLGLATALAVADALEALGAAPCLKWPNDILLNGCKVAGILVETFSSPVMETEPSLIAILGIGINVRQTEFPDLAQYATPPTSLHLSLGNDVTVDSVRDMTAVFLESRFASLEQQGGTEIYPAWQAHLCLGSVMPGTFVEMGTVNGEVQGK